MSFFKRHWHAIILWLAPLIFVGPALFSGQCIGAFDQVRQLAPWNAPAPVEPWDILQVDSVLQFYPWRKMVLEAWGNGEKPYWNPHQLGGTPLMANSQSAAFYPPHIALGVLHVPVPVAINLLAWFHLALGGIGLAQLIRRLGGNKNGMLIGGLAFSLSPFMLSWTSLSSVISTCAWIPWILAGIVTILDDNSPETELTPRWKSVLQISVSTAMMLLAGHLQFAAYGLFSAAALLAGLALVVVWNRNKGALFAVILAAVSLGAGCLLAMPQLKPVLAYGEYSHRKGTPTEEGYKGYLGLALHTDESIGRLINPLAQGNPREPLEQVSTYLPAVIRHGANYAESAITVGPIIVFGMIFALAAWKSKLKWVVSVLAAVFFSMACGGPLNRLLYFYFPGWSATGSPGRIEVLFLLFSCALAGLGYSKIKDSSDKEFGIATIGFLVVSLVSLFIGGFSLPAELASTPSLDAAIQKMSTAHMATVLASFVLTVYLAHSARKRESAGGILAVATVAFVLLTGGGTLIPRGNPNLDVKTPASPHERFAVLNSPWSLATAAPAFLPPNTASILGLDDIGGYDSLLHRETVGMLHEINGKDPAPEANGNMMFLKPGYDPQKLGEAGVTRVFQAVPNSGSFEEIMIPSRGRAYTKSRAANIVFDGHDHQKLEAFEGGTLTVKDRKMEGWSAFVDGKEVPIQGTLWREVELGTDGKHLVEFKYSPPGLNSGMVLALAGIVLIALLLLFLKFFPKFSIQN